MKNEWVTHEKRAYLIHKSMNKSHVDRRWVPGLGQITWWIVMTKKMRGHSGKKNVRKSRNRCRVNGRSCGCIGTVDAGPKFAHSWNQIQMLKECFYCRIYCAHLWPRVAAIVTASCAVSNREFPVPSTGGMPQSCMSRKEACHLVLQCVAVCCSVLQCVAVCCSVLQCVAIRIFCRKEACHLHECHTWKRGRSYAWMSHAWKRGLSPLRITWNSFMSHVWHATFSCVTYSWQRVAKSIFATHSLCRICRVCYSLGTHSMSVTCRFFFYVWLVRECDIPLF